MSDDFDRRLEERMRAYESRVPAPGPLPTPPRDRRARWPMIVGAGAAGTIVALAAILALDDGEVGVTPSVTATASARASSSATATPFPSGSPSSEPSPSASAESQQNALEVVLQHGQPGTTQVVTGLVEGPAGGVAAVTVYGFADIPATGGSSNPDGAIYMESPDGSWTVVDTGDTFEGIRLGSITRQPGGSLVVHGYIDILFADGGRQTTGAWTSRDGTDWTEVSQTQPFGEMASGPLGHVQATYDGEDQVVSIFTSADAVSWDLAFTRPVGDGVIRAVGAGPEGFVVVAETHDGDDQTPVVFASSDGNVWFEAPPQPSLGPGSIVTSVAPLGPDWVAVGLDQSQPGVIASWWSANGLDWETAELITSDAEFFGFPAELVSVGDLVVLSASQAAEGAITRPIGTWLTGAGLTWEPLALGDEAEVRTALVRGDRVLLGGRIRRSEGAATIWSWVPAELGSGARP